MTHTQSPIPIHPIISMSVLSAPSPAEPNQALEGTALFAPTLSLIVGLYERYPVRLGVMPCVMAIQG